MYGRMWSGNRRFGVGIQSKHLPEFQILRITNVIAAIGTKDHGVTAVGALIGSQAAAVGHLQRQLSAEATAAHIGELGIAQNAFQPGKIFFCCVLETPPENQSEISTILLLCTR